MTETLKRPNLLIVTVALGILLNPLNSSMIAVAITRFQSDFHLTFSNVSWLISTYYLASAVAQPVMGKLSDMFGAKRLFLIGLILIAISSILAPFSPGFIWLVSFRIIQAVGSSTLFPSGMSMIRKTITERQARALALLAVFSSTSAAFGPSIGGLLIHYWDWPALFFVNFPFIIASFFLGIALLPKDAEIRMEWKRIDVIGIILFVFSVVFLLIFLLSLGNAIKWIPLVIGLIGAILFIWFEKRKKEPFIDPVMLMRNKNASLVYVQFILINIIFYSIFFGMPSFLQQVRGYSDQQTGFIMLAIAGFGVVITPMAGRWIDRKGSKPAVLTGAISVIVGALLLLTVEGTTPLWWVIIVLSALGVSNGFNNIGMQTTLYEFVPKKETGAASGLFMTSRYMGTILSSTLLGIVFDKTINAAHFHEMTIVCVVVAVFILVLSIRMPNPRKQRQTL
ncbi:MFS transporter [Pullulanibacillus sp. KACC 23026]|uniref:MFS transporter n=1 Tax=Pullulanibacillus sp. KACC 23026 TaxID=3028315 RepID=UPI0023B06972|nr:MFS transporter [Pullulanibacillus sp. KACC 23026]WEG12304.1 MFS transporter [Pullulanibacillus sp. KACC 23026]